MNTNHLESDNQELASLYAQLREAQAEIREATNYFFSPHGEELCKGDTLLERIQALTSYHEEMCDEVDEELAQTQAELSVARATIARYRRVTAIAATILDVASHTHVANLHLCPHGNSASYPTHGWWCDGCFLELEDALAAIRTEEAQG